MKLDRLIAVGMLGAALAAPAAAQSQDPLGGLEPQMRGLDPGRWLGRAFSETDAERFFAWVRASIAAAAQGRDAPPLLAELQRKAETLSRELASRGALAGLALLDALEESARRALRDAQRPPAPLPGAI